MANDFSLNFDNLLKPINADNPAGNDLRQNIANNSFYYQLKEIRNEARNAERKAVLNEEPTKNQNHWKKIHKLAHTALTLYSKDLEITAWLIEALLRLRGFSGLRDGFYLTRKLIEQFWDYLYPSIEESVADKVIALTGLNGEKGDGTLLTPIMNVAIVKPLQNQTYSFWHYQQALKVESLADPKKRDQRLATGIPSLQLIKQTAQQTSIVFFRSLIEDIEASIDEFTQLNKILQYKCQLDAPPSSHISQQLENCLLLAKDISNNHAPPVSTSLPVEESSSNELFESLDKRIKPIPNISKNIIYSHHVDREQALNQILQIATYFRTAEPHSPLSYMLEKIVHFGKLDFPTLMKELIADDQIYKNLFSKLSS